MSDLTKDIFPTAESIEPFNQRTPLRRIAGEEARGLILYNVDLMNLQVVVFLYF